uniref:Uncharacterized protein n=1 Tax=Heterorhabditis bacteriophora TaxID=37862 RepID=A0A1I7WYW7_HETBA
MTGTERKVFQDSEKQREISLIQLIINILFFIFEYEDEDMEPGCGIKVEVKEEVQDDDAETLITSTKPLSQMPPTRNEPIKLGALTGLVGYGGGSGSDSD